MGKFGSGFKPSDSDQEYYNQGQGGPNYYQYYYAQHNPEQPQQVFYKSVESQIKLPKTIPVPKESNIFNKIQLNGEPKIPENLEKLFKETYQQLSHSFFYYDKADNYKFKFPQSKFDEVPEGTINSITYEQKMNYTEEDTFKDRLSFEQLQQIWNNGEFQIKSANQFITLPYVWKINDFFFRGKKNIQIKWMKGLAFCYDCLVGGYEFFLDGIPRAIRMLYKIPKRVFSLIFGKFRHEVIYTADYHRQICKDFFEELYDSQYSLKQNGWGKDFWMHLFTNFTDLTYTDSKNAQKQRKKYEQEISSRDKKISVLRNIDNKFTTQYQKQKRKIMKGIEYNFDEIIKRQISENQDSKLIEQRNEQEKEEIVMQEMRNKKFNLYINCVKQQLPKAHMDNKMVQTIITLLRFFQILMVSRDKINAEKQKITLQIKKQISQKFPVRSLSYKFSNKELNKRQKPIHQNIQNTFYNNLLQNKQINSLVSIEQKRIYNKFLEFRQKYNELLEQKKKTINTLKKPSRVFYSTYKLLPPYQVVQSLGYNNRINYSLKTFQPMTIDTKNNFWKIRLYIMRLKSWTINCFVFLVGQAYKGPFGLRCLFGTQKFAYDEGINYQTGVKYFYYNQTVIGVFSKVLSGINKSRQNFQATPDRGLFGKKFSRIFNLLECYLFRLIFVGIILVLIIRPIAIVANIILSTVLVITIWAWMPIIMIITYVFNILVFQFESSYIPRGIIVRSVPLLSLVIVVMQSILIVLASIAAVLLSPFVSLVVIIYKLTQRLFRTFTDWVMYYLFKFLGRAPSRDTFIAKKISGPGMSKSFYMSLNQEDVYILTQSQLQKIFMAEVNRHTLYQIRIHQRYFHSIMNRFLNPYVSSKSLHHSIIDKNCDQLVTNFNRQYGIYMNRFPRRPQNVRFTQQQIQQYFENSVRIVKNFIQKKNIDQWIFKKKNIIDGDYQQLTRQIWIELFSCGQEIFEPLQKIDQRFKLSDYQAKYEASSSKNKKIHSVMTALQGQVQLNAMKPRIARFKPSLYNIDPSIQTLNNLVQLYLNNSQARINLNMGTVNSIFVPQLNIKEAIKYDNNYYQKIKREYKQTLIE